MASPITTALATRWIEDGTARCHPAVRPRRIDARASASPPAILPAAGVTADPHGFHIWMTLPEGWTRSAFASQARSAGLGIVASDAFTVAGQPPEAVRICLGGPSTRAEITQGLEMLAHALEAIAGPGLGLHLSGIDPAAPHRRGGSAGKPQWTSVCSTAAGTEQRHPDSYCPDPKGPARVD